MGEKSINLLEESETFSRDSKATFVKYSPKVSNDGVVYMSPASKNERTMTYNEIRKAVLKTRKI